MFSTLLVNYNEDLFEFGSDQRKDQTSFIYSLILFEWSHNFSMFNDNLEENVPSNKTNGVPGDPVKAMDTDFGCPMCNKEDTNLQSFLLHLRHCRGA